MVQNKNIRPTKKQQELLTFIDAFIQEHGYSPSYREIMVGCSYNSVATVSLHVNNLIKRGHIVKRDHSARSLEIVVHDLAAPAPVVKESATHETWFAEETSKRIEAIEHTEAYDEDAVRNVEVLVEALHILGAEEAAQQLSQRLERITATPAPSA